MAIIRRYGETDFITGLRAIAATMVVVIHTGAFADLGWIGANITGTGKYGVQMFFVISGFTIAATFSGSDRYGSYLIRRLFRIAPLYWLLNGLMVALVLTAILPPNYWMERFGGQIDAYNILMHITFLSFLDQRTAASFIGLEWTIPIEVFWYGLLPFVISRCASQRDHNIALLLLLALASATRAAAEVPGISISAHWFPTTYGPYFLLGVICFELRKSDWVPTWPDRTVAGWACVLLYLVVIMFDVGAASALIGAATAGLIVLYRTGDFGGVLESRPMLFVGSISYSIYLWHLIVVMFAIEHAPQYQLVSGPVRFGLIFVITLLLSVLTYLVVEQPTNRLGAWVAAAWSKRMGPAKQSRATVKSRAR